MYMCVYVRLSQILYICVFVYVNTACMLTVSPCLLSISCLLSRVSLYQTAFKRYFRIPGYKRKPAAQINRAGHRNCIISVTDTASGLKIILTVKEAAEDKGAHRTLWLLPLSKSSKNKKDSMEMRKVQSTGQDSI